MKRFLFLLLLIVPLCTIAQQPDSLKNEILSYPDVKSSVISKGRKLLLDKFLEGDLKKVDELTHYLMSEVSNDDYVAFYPVEYWLILYWTNEYDELLNSITGFDSLTITSFNKKIKPVQDMLFYKILEKTRQSVGELEGQVRGSGLSAVDKSFLAMNLNYLISSEDYPDISQDRLNNIADEFLSLYPGSVYEAYTRKNIRYKFVPSKWGFAFEFFSGYGQYTGDLKQKFSHNVPFGVAFDICYKNFALYLRDYLGFGKTHEDIPYENGTWEKGSRTMMFLPEASLGYVVLDNNRCKLSPFVGIAATGLGPTEYETDENPDLEDADLGFSGTYSFGVSVDLKLGRSKIPMVSYGPEHAYWFLRFRYSYNIPHIDGKYASFEGNIHAFTIGIGGFGRKIKREL